MSNETTKKSKKSKYQRKIARKHGRGKVDPKWMWWMDRSAPKEDP